MSEHKCGELQRESTRATATATDSEYAYEPPLFQTPEEYFEEESASREAQQLLSGSDDRDNSYSYAEPGGTHEIKWSRAAAYGLAPLQPLYIPESCILNSPAPTMAAPKLSSALLLTRSRIDYKPSPLPYMRKCRWPHRPAGRSHSRRRRL